MSLATLVTGCVAAETRAVGEIVPGGASQAGERDGILVPEHFVPTPKTISAEAQAMLRSASAMLPSLKAPRTRNGEAGWKTYFREFRAAGDAGIMAMAARLDFAMRYPCEVVTHALSDSNIYELTPKNLASANRNRALYYVHGGAFTLGGGEAAIALASQLGGIARCRTFVIDYRMVPDVAFPVPLDDTIEGYRFVVERVNPAAVGVYGPSAGANIAPAMLLKARDLGLPLPAACALHSSPSDLAVLGDTAHTNVLVNCRHSRPMWGIIPTPDTPIFRRSMAITRSLFRPRSSCLAPAIFSFLIPCGSIAPCCAGA
jgi:acetyl esterase/lipase